MTALPRSLPSLVRGRESRDVSSPGGEKAERRAAWSCGSRRSGKRSSAVGSVRASRPSQSKSVARCFLLLRVFLTGLSADMIKDACKRVTTVTTSEESYTSDREHEEMKLET